MISPSSKRSFLEGLSRGAAGVAAECNAAGYAGLLFSPLRDQVEWIFRKDLSLALSRALSTNGGTELLRWARRSPRAHLIRRENLGARGREISQALDEDGLEGVALLPLLGEGCVLGYLILGLPLEPRGSSGLRPELTDAWGSLNGWLHSVREHAGLAVLDTILALHRNGLGQKARGLVVLDSEDRILFSHGITRIFPSWGRGEVTGLSLKSLPGGRVLAGLAPAGSGHLDWRTRKFSLDSGDLLLSLAALPLRFPREDWLPWRGILVGGDDALPGRILLEMALRLGAVQNLEPEEGRNARGGILVREALAAADQAQEDEAVDLSGLFRGFLHRLEPELQDDRIRILPLLQEGLPPVRGNRGILETALWAILRRAWTSLLPRGGTITLRTWEEAGSVWCTISDDGEGIEEGIMPELLSLEPLPGSVDTLGSRSSGMSMARALLRKAGGTFHVEERSRLWTRYSLVFPAERVVQRPQVFGSQGIPPAVEVHRGREGHLAVLVVDDNKMVRTVLRRYLERQGHEVMEAVDGGVALEILRDRAFDRVMVDIDMPGTTGVEFFQKLNSVNPLMMDRTVFMTGGFQEAETEDFIQDTGRPHLQKPFDLTEIGNILTC